MHFLGLNFVFLDFDAQSISERLHIWIEKGHIRGMSNLRSR